MPPEWQAPGASSGAPPTPPITPDALWMDASDSATITQSSSRVSAWVSKVGSVTLTQATGANQPLVSTDAFGGRQSVYFDGAVTAKGVSCASGAFTYAGVTGITIYSVIKMVTAPSLRIAIGHNGGNQVLLGTGPTITNLSWFGGAFTTRQSMGSILGTTIGRRVTGVYNLSGVNAAIDGYLDGAAWTTVSYSAGPGASATPGATSVFLGANVALGSPIDGYIAEVLIYKSAHTAPQIAAVDAYLAAKWGL